MIKVILFIIFFTIKNCVLTDLLKTIFPCGERNEDLKAQEKALYDQQQQYIYESQNQSSHYSKNLIKVSPGKQGQNGIYSKYKNTIDKCIKDSSIIMQIVDVNMIGEGSQAKIYKDDDKILKVPNDNQTILGFENSINEFNLMRNYSKEDPNLFIQNINCYFENYKGYPHFIIQMPLLGNHLSYEPSLQISGGEKIFQIEELSTSVIKRFEIYLQLFKQLEKFYQNSDVHSDIKPDNIMSNFPFEDLITKKRSIEELKLYIIDYGLMVDDDDDDDFSGTINFMHPMFFSRRQREKIHKHDVYQLCLTLLIIETYQFDMGDNFIFEMYSNKQQKQMITEIEKTKILKTYEKNEIYLQSLESYRQFFVDQFMDPSKQVDFITEYQKYNRSLFGQFMNKFCEDSFHCILITCLSNNITDIPSVPTIIYQLEKLFKKNKGILI